MMMRSLVSAVALLIVMTLLTGIAYPVLITGISKVAFQKQASGSLIERNGKSIGSSLIGQNFTGEQYFWGRPSATSPQPYNASASSGSNLGPLNPALTTRVAGSVEALRKADPHNRAPIPVDLVTASASGLDPEISPAAARYQAARVATARGISIQMVSNLIEAHSREPFLGMIGERRVNVLELNLALDERK